MQENEWKAHVEQKLSSIDSRLNKIERDDAVSAERYITTDRRLQAIESTLQKLMWLVVGGILSGFVAFVISGGLAGVQ